MPPGRPAGFWTHGAGEAVSGRNSAPRGLCRAAPASPEGSVQPGALRAARRRGPSRHGGAGILNRSESTKAGRTVLSPRGF